jgi:hypothetical protein
MDRSDPRYTNPLDPYYAQNVSAERRHIWERVSRLPDDRLMNELAAALTCNWWLTDPAVSRLRRRATAVVHYRMVRRQVALRMKRGAQ